MATINQILDMLNKTRFAMAKKGYSAKQVDEFVDQLRGQLLVVFAQIREQNEEFIQLKDQQEQIARLRDEAATAQAKAVARANRQAEEILAEAETQAKTIRLGLSHGEAAELLDLMAQSEKLNAELQQLRNAYEEFRKKMALMLRLKE